MKINKIIIKEYIMKIIHILYGYEIGDLYC